MKASANDRATQSVNRLNSYITDMQALEMHIEKAIFAQIADLEKDDPQFAASLSAAHDMIAQHITNLGMLVEARGIGAGSVVAGGVKKVVSVVAGFGAAAIDIVRGEDLPKNLRDDFAAFNLAEIGYAMLHASAVVLGGETDVGELALAHMRDYAMHTSALRALTPASVLRFLDKKGFPVSESQLARVVEAQSERMTVA